MSLYRLAFHWRLITYIVGPPMIILFGYVLTLPFGNTSPFLYLLIPVSLAMIFLFIYGIADAWVGVVVLADDRVIIKSPLGVRMLMIDEIKGYKIDEHYIHALPLEAGKKKIRISTYLEKNDEIRDWFAERFFNLDLLSSREEEQRILQNQAFGITEESRGRKLREARIVARIVNGVSWFVMGWVLFSPRPYGIAITAGLLFPMVIMTVMYLYRGLMRADDHEKSAYPSMAVGFGLVTASVALRALLDFSILDHKDGWYVMAVMALILSAAYAYPSGEWKLHDIKDYFFIGAMMLIMYMYSYGICILVNCTLDRSHPRHFRSVVVDKKLSKGKTYTYYLVIAPWGALREAREIKVAKGEYESVDAGAKVDIVQRDGYLQMPWVEVHVN